MNRRHFVAAAAAGPLAASASAAAARLDRIPARRTGKVEIVFNWISASLSKTV